MFSTTTPRNVPTSLRELSSEELETVAGGAQIHVIPEPPPLPGQSPPPPKVVIT